MIGFDGEAGDAAVEQGDGPRFELIHPRRRVLGDVDLGVVEVVDDGGDGPIADDNEHR